MLISNARRVAAGIVVIAGLAQAAAAADILINDAKSGPESLTVAPGRVLIVGSANTPFVYKVRAGATTAEKSDDNSVCNDFAIGPDKALYITDTGNGTIFRLAAGATAAELFLEDKVSLGAIDGITFLNGTIYANNVRTSKIYRVPVDAAGKASPAIEIVLDQPLKGPDGMRAANGKILVAENGAGRISSIAVSGDKGTVTVLKEGLMTPTAVEPAGDTIWIAERGTGKAVSIPMPK